MESNENELKAMQVEELTIIMDCMESDLKRLKAIIKEKRAKK